MLLGAYFAWRFYGGAYGALSVNSRKTAISVTTPVAVDFGYSTLLSHHSIFQASYLTALKPRFDIVCALEYRRLLFDEYLTLIRYTDTFLMSYM